MKSKYPLYFSSYSSLPSSAGEDWKEAMAEMVNRHLNGEPIYVELTGEPMREGSIARLVLDEDNLTDILTYNASRSFYQAIKPRPKNVQAEADMFRGFPYIKGYLVWDKRSNKVNYFSTSTTFWLKDRKADEGTVWVYKKPEIEAVIPLDRLGREIKVNDFISYILYHFQGDSAAGIYYGKVTKIDKDGTVWAKNIQLKETERTAEKRIKDNSLIVKMTDDLMDQLMLARLASI
jgi:hypothetical protein